MDGDGGGAGRRAPCGGVVAAPVQRLGGGDAGVGVGAIVPGGAHLKKLQWSTEFAVQRAHP